MAFTKYTGNITGQNGSLITALDAALVAGEGWSKAYGDANNGAYVQAAGNGFYLRVEDDGPGAGGAKEARIVGYESMSDIDTGTNPFPSVAQFANGLFARKSVSADATNRAYKIFADDRTCYVFISTGDTAGEYTAFAFGDFYSLQAADGYRTFIVGRITENSGTDAGDRLDVITSAASPRTTATTGHFVARTYTGLGTSITVGKLGDAQKSASAILAGSITYPNTPDGGAYFSQLHLWESAADVYRGRLRGLWQWMHPKAALTDGDTISGTGTLTGKTIEFVVSSKNSGVYAMETSDTLETN